MIFQEMSGDCTPSVNAVMIKWFKINPLCCVLLLSLTPSYAAVEPSLLGEVEEKSTPSVALRVPNLAAPTTGIFEQSERKLGEAILRAVRAQMPIFDDPWTQDELRVVFERISAQAAMPTPVGLELIRDDQINAFAVPGGMIAINTGLILQATEMDEVAGVLAHEVAHVSQKHFSRRSEELKYDKWLSMGGILAGMLITKQDQDIGSAIATGVQAATASRQLAYSRDHEREADRLGMELMRVSGYSPHAMASFFEVMQKKQGALGFLPDFVLTHPLTQERISEAKARATAYPIYTSSPQALQQFRRLQGRMAALLGRSSVAALKPAAAQGDDAAQLSLATVYRLSRQFTLARQTITPLLQHSPDDVLVHLVAAEIEYDDGQYAKARQLIAPLTQVMPEQRTLQLMLAKIDSKQGQIEAALTRLNALAQRFPHDVVVWEQLLTTAYQLPDTPHKTLEILRYRAESQFWQGQMDQAIVSLERAVKLSTDQAQKNQLQTRIDDMRADRKIKV